MHRSDMRKFGLAKFQFKYTVLQNIFPNTNAKIDPKIRMKKKKRKLQLSSNFS